MKNLSKKDWMILMGNVMQHFDLSIYVFLSPILSKLFFPDYDPLLGIIMVYAVMTTSIITRPVGTFIFSKLEKSTSPSYALSIGLIGVGVCTALMGLVPTYGQIGIFAPILLILLRVVRGVFCAGKSTISKLYILEGKEEGSESYKFSYLFTSFSMCGTIFASLVAAIIFNFELENWWRLCFLIGLGTVIPGMILQKNLSYSIKDSQFFSGIKYQNIFEEFKVLWNNKYSVLSVSSICGFSYLTYIIPFVVMNNLIPEITDITYKEMMALNSALLFVDVLSIPIIGKFTARFNYQSVMLCAAIILSVTIFPLWYFLHDASIYYVTFVRLWVVLWGVVFLCPLNYWCKKQVLNKKDQYIVVGIGSTIGDTIIGKPSSSILLLIFYVSGSHVSMALYAALIFLASAFVIMKNRK